MLRQRLLKANQAIGIGHSRQTKMSAGLSNQTVHQLGWDADVVRPNPIDEDIIETYAVLHGIQPRFHIIFAYLWGSPGVADRYFRNHDSGST